MNGSGSQLYEGGGKRCGKCGKRLPTGGVKAIDFYCLNGMIKVNWLKAFLKNSDAFWYCIPTQLFSRVGGLPFLLSCDFTISKLPIQLSDFH